MIKKLMQLRNTISCFIRYRICISFINLYVFTKIRVTLALMIYILIKMLFVSLFSIISIICLVKQLIVLKKH